MKRLHIWARVLLLLTMVASGLFGATGVGRALAQGGGTFVSPMTGIPITTAGPWTLDPASVFSQDGIESVTLESEFEFMQVWFMPGDVDLVQARDVVLDSFAQTFGTFVEIDRGAYGNVSYSLDITSSEGVEFGVFSLFLGQRESGYVEYYVFFGALSLFAQGFASAQQNVTVNGTPVFGGVDGVGLQNLLLANAGVTGASPSTTTQAPPVPATEPAQPPQDPQPTQPPATGGDPGTAEGDAYIQALQGEITYLQGTVGDFLTNYMLMETAADTAIPEMDRVAGEWRAYPQRAAGIVAPAGFETVDASYRAIVTEAEALAGLWDSVIQSAQAQDGTTGTKIADLVIRVMSFQVMIEDLNTALTANGAGTTTTAAPTDDTTGQSTGGLTAEQVTYIQSVRGELDTLEGSIYEFLELFGSISSGANNDEAIAGIQTITTTWASYPDTAAALPAPAGLEDVGTQYQAVAAQFQAAAATFNEAMQAIADGDQATVDLKLEEFSTQLETLLADIVTLRALLDQHEAAGTATTATTPEPTAGAQPTEQPTTTGTADGEAYVAAIAGETQAIMDSVASFAEGFQLLGSTDTAEQEQGIAQVEEVVAYWSTYDQVAAGIVAPAGYEDVDAAYRQLASDVTNLATLFGAWIDSSDADRAAASDAFSTAFDSVQAQIQELEAMIGVTSTGGTTSTSGQEGGPTDITETGNRGELPQVPTQGDDPQDTGNTAPVDAEELGLVSESEYVSPQFETGVAWDDRWAFDPEITDTPIGSDEQNAQDWITLAWTSGDAGVVTIWLGEEGEYDLEEIVGDWESDEYLESLGVTGDVVLSDVGNDRGGVMILLDDADGTVLYREAVCLSRACDELAIVELTTTVMDASDVIGDAEEGIEIEGEAATGVFSTREINRALDQ